MQAVSTATRGPRGARGEGSPGPVPPLALPLAVPQPAGPADPQSRTLRHARPPPHSPALCSDGQSHQPPPQGVTLSYQGSPPGTSNREGRCAPRLTPQG